MFGGGAGLNPRKLQQMMEQMGIEVEELDAESVVITQADGTTLRFEQPDVTMMEARGQKTYQIIGDPVELEATDQDTTAAVPVPEEDIQLVMDRAGVDEETARDALTDADGDLAAAITRLE